MAIPLQHLATAFISPAFHAWANTIDNLFSERFKGKYTFLISVSKLLQLILVLPLFLLFQPALAIPPLFLALLIVVAIVEFTYVYPYFWAMAHTDTSVVVALFSIGKIIVPLLAWLLLDERLSIMQYFGFFVIILASLMLTLNWRKFHLNKAAWCMLLASALLSIETIITKYVLMHGVAWETVAVLTVGMEGLIGAVFLCFTAKEACALWRKAGSRVQWLFLAEAALSMVGNAASVLALSLLPASVVKAMSSTQHLFVAAYAKLFHPIWPNYFKEDSTDMSVFLKWSGLMLTVVGTILAAGYLV